MSSVWSPEVPGSAEGTTRTVTEGSKLAKRLVFTEIGLTPLVTSPPGRFYSPSKLHLPLLSPLSIVMPDSPRSLPQATNLTCGNHPKGHRLCQCKHSRCLKLYCRCFSLGTYCDGCGCVQCHNNIENETNRAAAIEIVLGRNPHAFRPRITYSPCGAQVDGVQDAMKDNQLTGKHNKGCHCKKTQCIKKYCECFLENILCSENCKCIKCKNVEGCEQRIAASLVDFDDIHSCIQHQNAATPTVGHSGHSFPQESRKRDFQKLISPEIKHPAIQEHTRNHQEKSARAAGFLPASSIHPTCDLGSSAALNCPKSPYRSLPAEIVLPLDTRQICSLLVEVSEAAKSITDSSAFLTYPDEPRARPNLENMTFYFRNLFFVCKNGIAEMQGASKSKTMSASAAPGTENFEKEQKSKGMGFAPGKGELSCEEKGKPFMGTAFQNLYHRYNESFYPEQERLILTYVRDCLGKLITSRTVKGKFCFV